MLVAQGEVAASNWSECPVPLPRGLVMLRPKLQPRALSVSIVLQLPRSESVPMESVATKGHADA